MLGSGVGLSASASQNNVPGLMINLNRPFEKLIRSAIFSTNRLKKITKPLNTIWLRDAFGRRRSTFVMRPDCRGVLEIDGKKFHLLADAKHKVFSSDFDESNIDAFNFINRNDFYQMISYAKTHSEEQARPNMCVLIGLNDERGLATSDVVKVLPSISVESELNDFMLHRLSINFGHVLSEIGENFKLGQADKAIFNLGESLIDALSKANAKSKAAA